MLEVGFKNASGILRWRTVDGGIMAGASSGNELLARAGRRETVTPDSRLRFGRAAKLWLDVAEHAGAPDGCITGRFDPDCEMVAIAIGLPAVAESARGRGLGSQLLAALLVAAAQRCIASLTVVT